MVSRVQRYISPIASRLAGLKYVDRHRLEAYFRQIGSSRALDLAKSAGLVKSKHQFVTPAEIAHYHFVLRLTEDKLAEAGIDMRRPPNAATPSGWIHLGATIRNPAEPTPTPPRSEVLPNYPKRGPLTRAYPHLANVGFWLYLGLRLLSITMVSFISLPIAIALFAAEFHSIFNGIFFQGDIKNEGRYETWKRQNWPSDAEIRQAMGPDGPLTVMHISSAPEPPDTVWPTLYGVLEMEGNKQVVWNTESTKLEIHPKVKKQIREDVEREGLSGNAAKAEIKKREIAHIYALKKELFDVVNEEYATVWQYIRSCVPRNWKSLDINSKRAALQEIWRMLGKRFITRGAIWTWWGSESEHIPGDATFAELLSRVYHGALRNLGDVPESGLWKEVDIESFGFLDETGQFHSFANNLDVLTAKAKRYLSETYASPTEQQLYGFEYMKKLLVDYKQDQFDSFVQYLHKKFIKAQEERRLKQDFFIESLKDKGAWNNANRQQLEGVARGIVEQLILEQDTDRQLRIIYHFIDSHKNNLYPVWHEYFPRNIRSAGEDIKTGLEYETRAEEVGRLSEASLDEEWERIFNTYSNAQVIWWDRMQLIDSDPQGRKANSLNSCVHHLQGNWVKVIKVGDDPDQGKTDGYLIAKDLPSAVMRLCLEKFENGQLVWDSLKEELEALEDQGVRDAKTVANVISQKIHSGGVVPEKRFFVENFRLNLENQGPLTKASLIGTLQAEGLWNDANSQQLEKAAERTARWLNEESESPEKQRRILYYFMDRQRDNLILIPNKDDIRAMVEEALKDTKVPDGYREAGSYDFGKAVYFLNLDAEGRPASRLMRQTVPFFHRLVNGREVPPPQSLLGRIAARLFGRDNPPQIGFLQIPQFYTIDRQIGDPLQTVAHTDQRLFYENIQTSKSIGHGAFSCGAGALYDIRIKRELGHVEFNDPENPNKPQAPGGWSYELTAAEVEYQTRHHGEMHHVIAYQPQKSPTEDHAHSAMGALRGMGAKNGERGIFQDEVLNKGESPKDVGNLLGKQHPKWAGGTIGDFGYIILPAYLRWLPGASNIAQGIIWLLNNRAVRALAWPAIKIFKGIDRVSQKIPVWKTLWNNLIKAPARYSEILTWEVAMSHKGKLNPFSKTGREFFRSGTWYFRGLRDLILMSAPVLLVSSIFSSALIGSIITGAFTPIVLNPLLFLAVFVPYLIFSVGSYIHHSKRYGLSFKEVFLQKEAVFLGLGWPAYLHADLWGLRGPSGRLGATTTKGVGGREALPNLYWIPTAVVGGLSLLNVGIGSWLFANTAYYLGWAVALSGPGLGILFCSFWALYHAYMIYRGFKVSQHFKIRAEQ